MTAYSPWLCLGKLQITPFWTIPASQTVIFADMQNGGSGRLAPRGAITQGAVQAVRLGSFAGSVRPGTGERVWPVSVARPSGSRVQRGIL